MSVLRILQQVCSHRLLLILIGLVTVAACGGGGSSSRPTPAPPPPPPPPNTAEVSVSLSGLQVLGGGADSGSATADLSIDLDDGALEGGIELTDIDATQVNLYEGFAGEVSRLIVELIEDSATAWSLPADTTLSAAQLALFNAGGLHVKVVTAEHPQGAVRGQILPGNLQVFMASLDGRSEIPQIDTAARGVAGITFDPDGGAITVHVQTEELDEASAGHIHQAFAGRSGAVVVELEQDQANGNHWMSVAGAGLDASQAANLEEGSLYVNIHSTRYPAGEIRGQILGDELEVAILSLSGAQAAPGVATTAHAAAGATLNRSNSEIELHITAAGLDDATDAHVHEGFAGANGAVVIGLEKDPSDPSHWLAPAGTMLNEDQLAQFDAGQLYLNIHTPAHPSGEVRGQIAPNGVRVISVALSGEEEVPAIATAGVATAGLTIVEATSAVELHITTEGLDDAVAAHVHEAFAGANGGVVIELEQDANDGAHWVGPMDTVFDELQLASLSAGGLYLNVHTPAHPGGEVRGQILPENVEVLTLAMTGAQSVPAVETMATANAAVTLNHETAGIVVNINAAGLDDAVASHVHSGLAGATGPVVIELEQDSGDVGHWQTPIDTQLDEPSRESLLAGELYLNLHTPANPAGEVRGQIVPDGIEVLFTSLSPADVVPSSASTASGIAATTIDVNAHTMVVNTNLQGLDGATSVAVLQAPLGQTGPQRFTLDQDVGNVAQWSLPAVMLDDTAYAALRNRGFYVQASSVAFPEGAVRGQLEPAESSPAPGGTFVVAGINPANGATLESVDEVVVMLNRDPLQTSLDEGQFELLSSGGDASFSEGNETTIAVGSISLSGSDVSLDLSAATLDVDTYQLSLDPDAEPGLTDAAGTVLDGDNDGNPGGIFISTFAIEAAVEPAPTFTEIQMEVFDVSCALSGCHTGASPSQGMDLSAGQAYANIVDVASAQNAALDRIEPNDPDNSYLVRKVEGSAGTRMPLGQPALSNDLIQKIRDWVSDGAPDN